jgi:hypothetical protein
MDTVTMVELEGIARLAAKARHDGVKLYRDRRDGRHYASSSTTPGKHYYVTLASCQCTGFVAHQRCKHWAALQIATILQDGAPTPTPAAIATPDPDICSTCNGTGSECGTVASGRSWRYESITCATCHGAGTVHLAA